MSVRTYSAMGKAAANIVGYVGQISQAEYQRLKSTGLPARRSDRPGRRRSATTRRYLRGTPGRPEVAGRLARATCSPRLSTSPPVPGDNLRLSIDGHIQMVAEHGPGAGHGRGPRTPSTPRPHRNFAAPAGSAVVAEDPDNGQILALATEPTFDPNEFNQGGISEAQYAAYAGQSRRSAGGSSDTRGVRTRARPSSWSPPRPGFRYGIITPTSTYDDTGEHQDRRGGVSRRRWDRLRASSTSARR